MSEEEVSTAVTDECPLNGDHGAGSEDKEDKEATSTTNVTDIGNEEEQEGVAEKGGTKRERPTDNDAPDAASAEIITEKETTEDEEISRPAKLAKVDDSGNGDQCEHPVEEVGGCSREEENCNPGNENDNNPGHSDNPGHNNDSSGSNDNPGNSNNNEQVENPGNTDNNEQVENPANTATNNPAAPEASSDGPEGVGGGGDEGETAPEATVAAAVETNPLSENQNNPNHPSTYSSSSEAPAPTTGEANELTGNLPLTTATTTEESSTSNLFVVDRAGADPEQIIESSTSSPPNTNPSTVHNNPAPAAGLPTSTTSHAPTTHSGMPSSTAAALASAPVDPSVPATLTSPASSLSPVPAIHAQQQQEQVEEREEVSPQLIGKIIGKGGEMIRDLQARSGARIDVDQSVPVGQPRVVTYRGTRKTVDFARMLVRMLTTEGVSESDLPLGEATREILVIPAQTVGKVIGRGGEMIRELQSRSGAKIQVDHHGTASAWVGAQVGADKKQVTIIGTESAVAKAKEMIMFLVSNPMMDALQALNMLVEDKIKGNAWGTGPPYPNLPNQGYNMTPDMVMQVMPGGGGGYQHHQYGGGGGGGGAFFQGQRHQQQMGGGYGGGYAMQQQQSVPYQQAAGGGAYSQFGGPAAGAVATPAVPGAVEVDVTYVQKQFTGRIIGQKGVTINDLQRRSGCDIQVNQQQSPSSPDTEITIRGSRQGIDMVKQMIREILEAGPAHPYAGGADSGFSAGGAGQYGGGGGGAGGYGGYQQRQQQQHQGYDYSQAYGGYQQQLQQQAAYGQQPQQQAYGQQAVAQPVATGYGQAAAVAYGGYGQQQQQQQQPYGAAAVAAGYAGQQQQQPGLMGYVGGAGVVQAQPSAVVAPAMPPRVSAWKAATTPEGQVYYYNEQTGETQWEKPAGM